MSDLEQANRMSLMAGKDLQALKGMGDEEVFPIEIFGFHVQQAVEKTLKAWLCCLGKTYPKIHDLDELVALLEDAGQALPEEFAPLVEYTDFATTFRYEAYAEFGGESSRVETADTVDRFVGHVGSLMRRAEQTKKKMASEDK